ncbi:PREDICTED: probable Werner syndrome ATP-dependent helicase homolog 1 [Cyprinodon variegatus]|uniref:probable Werner syndrome ATP-dependent helicase homolog 1 n=1 Tax=Cyprinodon variegatus TaxID=28743 RepID=UPI0007427C56|nr:PREDICTED: probable Werner syndrome ATP-dependent helicase homolog 1 [Cyprinodon variegatus]
MQLGGINENDNLDGRCQLVFGSPESWLNEKWRSMLASEVYQKNLVGIVVDEVHVTYKWGEAGKGSPAFRESFARLGELRSIVKEGTPVMALTASADIVNRGRVTKLLNMEKATQVTVSPNRSNIRLGLKHVPSHDLDCMDWVVTEAREKRLLMSPIIIYCRSLKAVGSVFCHLKAKLGEDAWVNRDPEHKAENMLIGMFHSKTLPQYKQRVLASFTGESSCRVVVATTALGMGLNFPNISHVVMYGAPEDVEDIVQQVGRAGRNSLPSHAVLYDIQASPRVDKTVKALIHAGKRGCFRKALFSHFEEHTTSLEPGHLCCTYCHSMCSCSSGVCVEPTPKHESVERNVSTNPLRSREVTEEDKTVIRACLQQYRRTLVPDLPLITNKTLCTGFGTELIEAAVEHSPYIFDLAYITNHLPVFTARHASEILLVISEVFGDFEYIEPTLPEESFTEPDIDFTGYFDEQDEDFEIETQHSSGSESEC